MNLRKLSCLMVSVACVLCACDESGTESSCVAMKCPKPANAKEMACDIDGCFVRSCEQGFKVSPDEQYCVDESSGTGGETCPVEKAKCDKLYENMCCNGREYQCNYVDECEDNWDCKDWVWWANTCSTKFEGGWCDSSDNGVGTAYGCVFDKKEDPCNESTVGHIIYDARCDTVYNNFVYYICTKLDSGKYGYVGKGYARSICKQGDDNIKIECDKTHFTTELACNNCKESYDGANYDANCE